MLSERELAVVPVVAAKYQDVTHTVGHQRAGLFRFNNALGTYPEILKPVHYLCDGSVLGARKAVLAAWAEMKRAATPVQARHTAHSPVGLLTSSPASALRTSRLQGEARFLPGLALEPFE